MLRINLDKPKVSIHYLKHIDDDRGFRVSKCHNVRIIYNYDIPGNVYEADNIYEVCPECMAIKPETEPEKKGSYWISNWINGAYHRPVIFKAEDANKTDNIFEKAWLKWVEKNSK